MSKKRQTRGQLNKLICTSVLNLQVLQLFQSVKTKATFINKNYKSETTLNAETGSKVMISKTIERNKVTTGMKVSQHGWLVFIPVS